MLYDAQYVMFRSILSASDKNELQDLSQKYSLDDLRQDPRNYEEMTTDFVYTSAQIEGNTYERVETDNLLRFGITAGGKRYSDAVMLINLRDGFEKVMLADEKTKLDTDYVCDLHQVLMKNLLPAHEQGLVRISGVRIGASKYKPISDVARLRGEMQFILEESKKYSDPFDKAIYLHCNLAYLQYFRDGNKRTARLIQTATLVQNNILPLFFKDTLIDAYQKAVVSYYETGSYAPYVSFFKENYALVASDFLGDSYSNPGKKMELPPRF